MTISNPPLGPVAAVEVAISESFGDVVGLDAVGGFEVGEGAGCLEDVVVGTGD